MSLFGAKNRKREAVELNSRGSARGQGVDKPFRTLKGSNNRRPGKSDPFRVGYHPALDPVALSPVTKFVRFANY
jgi:hypothetical protein